jgi:hypothetical protein
VQNWASMAKQRVLKCRFPGCSESPYLGGLCEKHHDENQAKELLRDLAITALHHGALHDKVLTDSALRTELDELRIHWHRVCNTMNFGARYPEMSADEAEFASDWCISLAQELIKAQQAINQGKSVPLSLESTRSWVWERLRNLEAGLTSTGRPRK